MEREIDTRRFRRYELPGGWIVLAGRTDADNEFLSLRFARPDELWFHASGCAGSHVVLLAQEGLEPDREAVRGAAAVAAWHSKARKARRVPVSVVKAGDVSRQKGGPRGQVTIRKSRTVKVDPALPGGSET